MRKISVRGRLMQISTQLKNRIEGKQNALILHEQYRTNFEFGGGFIRGQVIGVTGDTAGAKTKYSKFLCLCIYFGYKKANNNNFKILWFGLEETEAEFVDSVLCTVYYLLYKEDMDYSTLNSFRKEVMTEEMYKRLWKCESLAQDFINHFLIFDDDTPEAIFNRCKVVCQEQGDAQINTNSDYLHITDTHYIAVVDHVSLLRTSGKETRHEAIERWNVEYAKKIITKKWNWTVLNILQQSFDSQKSSIYNAKGEINPRRVEPSMDKLGDNKQIARDHYLLIGMFNPYSFGIKTYPSEGYDILTLEDNYRCAIVLKNRYGIAMRRIHYYFHGPTFMFKELPGAKDEKMEEIYNMHKTRNLLQ